MSDEINDPTVMKPFKSYSDEEDNQQDTNSGYLKILFDEYKTKIHSAVTYLDKIKQQEGVLDKMVHDWTSLLHNKYEILDKFQQSRPRTTVPGDFNLEDRSPAMTNNDSDLKSVDTKITDHSEQINWSFEKLESYLEFLGTTFLDAQDTINKIYDRYMEIFENM
jgi:hypothetical protein